MDAVGQAELVRTGEASPVELVDAAIARIEAVNPQLNAVIHERFDRARTEAAGRPARRAVPRRARSCSRTSSREVEGEPLHEGMRFLRDAGYDAPRTDTLAAALPRRRLRRARPHQHPRARAAADHRARVVRPDAQPVEARPHARRLERRLRGRGRERHGPGRARQRRRRVDPHPGVVLWARRPQADARGRVPNGSDFNEITNFLVAEHVVSRARSATPRPSST